MLPNIKFLGHTDSTVDKGFVGINELNKWEPDHLSFSHSIVRDEPSVLQWQARPRGQYFGIRISCHPLNYLIF